MSDINVVGIKGFSFILWIKALKDMAHSIIDQLAHSLGSREETPNIRLAEKISKANDRASTQELISLLHHKIGGIRNDAIKVLYEIGERNPKLVIGYVDQFLKTLHHKDNRMIWGAMSALSAISKAKPELLTDHLAEIVDAMDNGSVITRDHGIYVLVNLSRIKKHHADCMELLLEQIEKAPVNQVPMYAEKTAEVLSASYLKRFEKILRSRKDVLEIPSKEKRIMKILKAITPFAPNSEWV